MLATEMGGAAYRADALDKAARAVRNGYRVLAWLGVEERLERPLPAETLAGAKQQLDGLESWVRQKVKDGWTPLPAKSVEKAKMPSVKPGKRRKIIDKYEANLRVKKYIDAHPQPRVRDVAKALGLWKSTVCGLDAWKREIARRKAAKPMPKIKERQLNDKMLASMGQNVDPAIEKVRKDDAIWQWLMNKAKPNERVELHMKTAQERETLIEMVREQYDQEHAEPDD